MKQHSTGYIIGFAVAICLVCSVVVSGSAVALKDRQELNKVLDKQKKVLDVAGLLEKDKDYDRAQIEKLFTDNIKARVVDIKTGAYVDSVDAATFDQKKAAKDPKTSHEPPANMAKVRRVPNNGLIYQVVQGGKVQMLILPIEGKGLWGTLYGFIALGQDTNTIQGITFYEHKETPGLGGEVDNPSWKGLWPGRKAFGPDGKPKIEVIKGAAGPVDKAPYQVDGMSGATITSRGVTHLLHFWLGEHGFGPYLKQIRQGGGQ